MGDGNDSAPAPDPGDSADQFVSLYRRFRPGRFADLRGQPHVVRALQGAVRDGRVAHAYLFSGPRGTGKTSTARILARALNCVALVDGEPCGRCSSCVEIAKGSSLDVHELDAASNNGVDAMRDLVSHAALATPGRSKVYIVDEVHMLSTAAANALLKTLEEPPAHVVFVLATTDPQKVPATIRSRTQHFDFRLLTARTLSDLLTDVRDRAGLALDDDAVSVAVRRGRGSARDALSALDLVAASGSADDVRPEIVELLQAVADDDGARTLVLATSLHEAGWGPQQLTTELVEELRETFLAALAPELAGSRGVDPEELAERARSLGLARLVRSIEVLGKAQVDMRDAPDARIVLEIALVRLARPELDDSPSALLDRLTRLERGVVPAPAPPHAAPAPGGPNASAPAPSSGGARPSAAGGATASRPEVAPAPPAAAASSPAPGTAAASGAGSRPTIGALRRRQAASSGTPQPDGAGSASTGPPSQTSDEASDTSDRPSPTPDRDTGTSDRDGGPASHVTGAPAPTRSEIVGQSSADNRIAPPGAESTRPGRATSHADTAPSGTTQPGTTQPGTAQPGTAQPGTAQPGTAQPGTAQPEPDAPSGPDVPPPDRDTLVQAWGDHVLRSLTPKAKALFSAGRFVSVTDDVAVFALPSVPHRDKCEELRPVVEGALAGQLGVRVRLKLVTETAGSGPSGRRGPTAGDDRDRQGWSRPDSDSSVDLDMEDADFDPDDPGVPVEIESVAEARLREAFPGAEEVDG